MKRLNQVLVLAGVAVALGLSDMRLAAQAPATPPAAPPGPGQGRQGRGNFDPEQMRQMMMERTREQLEIKGDDEWKIVWDRVEKVTQARMAVGGGFGGPGRGFGGPRPQRPGGDANAAPGAGDNQGGRRNRGMFGGEPMPEAEALQKAIESKASADELKAKLAAFREARKAREAKLEKAQDDLRKLLSVRQEAILVQNGTLK